MDDVKKIKEEFDKIASEVAKEQIRQAIRAMGNDSSGIVINSPGTYGDPCEWVDFSKGSGIVAFDPSLITDIDPLQTSGTIEVPIPQLDNTINNVPIDHTSKKETVDEKLDRQRDDIFGKIFGDK